jgi:Transcription factor S-II (TFIIS)
MRCRSCGVQDCVEIHIRLKDEETVRFYSCRNCEAKWWERDGMTIALDEVLNLAAESEAK